MYVAARERSLILYCFSRLLAKTVHRSLSRDEPHATIPLPYVPKHALQDEGYSTDDFITELTNFDEDRGPDF